MLKPILVAVVFIIALLLIRQGFPPAPDKVAVIETETPQQIAQRQAVQAGEATAKALQEAQWQKVLRAGGAIRAAMRNPPSLVYEDVRANGDASVMCFEYRAQNGFGGMGREFMVIQNGKPSQSPSAWNKNCTQPLPTMDLALWQLNRK